MSDEFSGIGLEHHQSSENGIFPGYLTGDAPFTDNYLLPHEYAHSWNGKFMRPTMLWTPHYSTPMQNDLLWVYEGQTEFWAWALAARAGLYKPQQAQEVLAANAALFEHRAGRGSRNLQDTVYQGIVDSTMRRRRGRAGARLRFLRRRHAGVAGCRWQTAGMSKEKHRWTISRGVLRGYAGKDGNTIRAR